LVLNIRFTIINQKAIYETNIKLERTRWIKTIYQ
jgi:hypothetical protein